MFFFNVFVYTRFVSMSSLLDTICQAQHLIFKYTEKGDLTGFISAYFDPKSAQARGVCSVRLQRAPEPNLAWIFWRRTRLRNRSPKPTQRSPCRWALSPVKATISVWNFPKIGGFSPHPILIGFSIIIHPFWGSPIFGNTRFGKILCGSCCGQVFWYP